MIAFLQNLVDAVSLGSLYALAALGIGLLFGILRLINFAHGDFITVGAYALIVPSTDAVARMFVGDFNVVALTLTVVAVVVVLALASDRILFRHLRRANPASLMIASFSFGYVIQNLLLMIYGGRPKAVGLWSQLNATIEIGALRVPLLQLIIIGVTLLLLLGLTLFMNYTRYGIQMRAASEDFVMARYLGIRADFVIGIAFAISGSLAALVSLLFVTQTGVLSPQLGMSVMIFAFVATVIGGMGSLIGAVIGGFVVGIVSAMLQAYLPADIRPFRDAFVFIIVILILLVRPSGIVRVKALTERV